jgi:hypothetical protein
VRPTFWRARGKLDVPKERFHLLRQHTECRRCTWLGRLGPPRAGTRPTDLRSRSRAELRLDQGTAHSPTHWPAGASTLADSVAQRVRPRLQRQPSRVLRRVPHGDAGPIRADG